MPKNNEKANAAFVQTHLDIAEALARLAQQNEEIFAYTEADNVTWSDVATLQRIQKDLLKITDYTFYEGEHAIS